MEEEDQPRSSIYVAPLKVVKPAPNGRDVDTASSTSRASPSRQHTSPSRIQSQYGTALSDTGRQTSNEAVEDHGPTFHNYLRAFYPFQPTDPLAPSTVTLPLEAGDIILVHSIHTNGWADGTLLDNGSRGWLPTNYCEAYEHLYMRPLLKALTDFWDVIRHGSGSTLDVFRNQDYMRGLIAGVRFLLEKSDCLTRTAPNVKRHESIRKTRKALLADLSALVKIAKRLQDFAAGMPLPGCVDDIFDEMLLKAFTIVTNGVRFLDIWTEEVELQQTVEGVAAILEQTITRSNDVIGSSQMPVIGSNQEAVESSAAAGAHQVPQPANPLIEPSAAFVEQPPKPFTGNDFVFPVPKRQSAASSIKSRPVSMQAKRTSISHRMSYTSQVGSTQKLNLASKKLDSCYDAFLGVLGSFLGLHMQSRSSAELLLTTQQAVKSCRELLAVVEIVLERDFQRSDALLEAKETMYDRITELVQAAREVFGPVESSAEDSMATASKAATACVRGAGECLAKARVVLERIGDFELESSELKSMMPTPSPPDPVEVTEYPRILSTDQGTEPHEAHEIPPAPTRPAPQLLIPDVSLLPPRSSPDLHTPASTVASSTMLTPDSPTNTTASPLSSTFNGPIFTPPTPALAMDDETSPVSETTISPQIPRRQKSLNRTVVISTGSGSTSSTENSMISTVSGTSSRATSPDQHGLYLEAERPWDRTSGSHSTLTDDFDETEKTLLEKTYAHEIMYNKEGQVMGGTLAALIEKLTAHDSAPDALFVSTFYLTFRLFTTPNEFAEALAYRFDYAAESSTVAGPVRLRVYNIFKGWLESHWRHDCDDATLPLILDFAQSKLAQAIPSAANRLMELADNVKSGHGPVVPRLLSSLGKTNTPFMQYFNPDSPTATPIISKSQLAALRNWKTTGAPVSILDFNPLELARQITIKESSIFCSILPEELLATEWNKQTGSLAVNVRAMSTLSTDLANLVADSILSLEEPKKRAVLIKHWVKIANKCLELNNYDTLMAIVCSLNSSTIARLKRTWEAVSQKTKATLEELRRIVDVSRNYAVLRQRIQNHVPPCLPFVGTYLTDLTFVDHGNQATRKLDTGAGSIDVINYDKHMKTARIISELQRFQIPYRLTEVPELQTWMQDQLVRVRSSGEKSFQNYYRRSLVLEPREQAQQRPVAQGVQTSKGTEDKFDFLSWAIP